MSILSWRLGWRLGWRFYDRFLVRNFLAWLLNRRWRWRRFLGCGCFDRLCESRFSPLLLIRRWSRSRRWRWFLRCFARRCAGRFSALFFLRFRSRSGYRLTRPVICFVSINERGVEYCSTLFLNYQSLEFASDHLAGVAADDDAAFFKWFAG